MELTKEKIVEIKRYFDYLLSNLKNEDQKLIINDLLNSLDVGPYDFNEGHNKWIKLIRKTSFLSDEDEIGVPNDLEKIGNDVFMMFLHSGYPDREKTGFFDSPYAPYLSKEHYKCVMKNAAEIAREMMEKIKKDH